ncbi:hypothetical protein NQ315_017354 [Exocentrus adspersus]|uniref:Uncharacterized protein n=1 Tax=Exocentrus adspersus TaxID=1586481 RepID=A0AAV8VJX8_9CUCU|nr:hypothetical protein NQ315_017354 [Exocentrus adspersus]
MENYMENLENSDNRQLGEFVHTPSESTFRIWPTEYKMNRAASDCSILNLLEVCSKFDPHHWDLGNGKR